MKRFLKNIFYLSFALLVVSSCFRIKMKWEARSKVYDLADLPPGLVFDRVLVLGAGVQEGGEPSRVLRDRVSAALEVYRRGQAREIWMSGDNRPSHRFETDVMRRMALDEEVPASVLHVDPQGYRTFDSCRNLASQGGPGDVLIVSQAFHLDRALYLCNRLGLQALGLKADRSDYSWSSRLWWQVREISASAKAWWDARGGRP